MNLSVGVVTRGVPDGHEVCKPQRGHEGRTHARPFGSQIALCGAYCPGEALSGPVECEKCNARIAIMLRTSMRKPLAPVPTRNIRVYIWRLLAWMERLGFADREILGLKARLEACTKKTHYRQVIHRIITLVADGRHGRCDCERLPHGPYCYLMQLGEAEAWSEKTWGVDRNYHQRSPHKQGEEAEARAARDWSEIDFDSSTGRDE